VKSTKEKEY